MLHNQHNPAVDVFLWMQENPFAKICWNENTFLGKTKRSCTIPWLSTRIPKTWYAGMYLALSSAAASARRRMPARKKCRRRHLVCPRVAEGWAGEERRSVGCKHWKLPNHPLLLPVVPDSVLSTIIPSTVTAGARPAPSLPTVGWNDGRRVCRQIERSAVKHFLAALLASCTWSRVSRKGAQPLQD